MSNLIEEVEISTSSRNGHYTWLCITYNNPNTDLWIEDKMTYNWTSNEDEAVVKLLDGIDDILSQLQLRTIINFQQFVLKVTEGFRQLRENDLNGNREESMTISLVAEKQPESHFSCKMNNNEEHNTQSSGVNDISQSEIQQKLAIVEKENKVMTFFEDNKCSVCLSSYKEMLDDNLHIVVPSCGHPLCCGCADNILKSTKKECPRCRGNITGDSFNLMKFNADLQMVTQDQRVFL